MQIYFDLSSSAIQARHLFGVTSVPIGPLASVKNSTISATFPGHRMYLFILRIFRYVTPSPTFLLEGPAALFNSFISSPNSQWNKKTRMIGVLASLW